MNRRIVLSIMAAAACILLMLVAAPRQAAAQQFNNPDCCGFTVEVVNVRDACLPLKVTTNWSSAGGTNVFTANGIYVNPPIFSTSCPPAPAFNWVSLDGGITTVGPKETKVVKVGGCCYTVSVGLDKKGCVYITINGFALSPCRDGL